MTWYPQMEPIEFVTVQQMQDYVKENNLHLLPYNSIAYEFWGLYTTNPDAYDRLFTRLYRNSYYFIQQPKETVASVFTNFNEAVYDLLLLNAKKYAELYRVHSVDDDDYSILDNYDVTETKTGTDTKRIVDAFGNFVIQEQENIGSQENEMVGQVAPYDSEDFANQNSATQTLGQRQDSSMTTRNPHTDNHTYTGSDSYTMNKKGNIGVQTQSEVMDKHANFWKRYDFMKLIFEDINREYLLFDHAYL